MYDTTNRLCFNLDGYGNAHWYDFERSLEGIWHTELQNSSGKDPKAWLQRISNKYNCSGPPALKSQKVWHKSNQQLLHHYQLSKSSSTHKLMQQILGSHELKGDSHLLTMHTQKSLNQLLAFLNLYQHAKNQFIPSVCYKIHSSLESCDHSGHTCFWPCPPKKN